MPAPRFHPFTRLVFCALGIFGVSILLGLMLLVGSAFSTLWTGQRPGEQLLDLATRFALPLLVLSYPASLLWLAFCRSRFDRRSFVSLGLRARRAFPDWSRGALVGMLSIGLLWSILWLTGAVSVGGWSPEAFEIGLARSVLALLGYATLFFAVGFFEETLFRGYALHNAYQWLGWRGAVAFQAVAFALVHLGNVANGSSAEQLAALGALPQLALIAVFFALCYRKTGSLWFPIGFHFAWNFCLGCIFSLPVSGISTFRLLDVAQNQNNWLSGGAFGAEGSFFLIPILLTLIYYISRVPDHPQALLDLELMNRAETVAAPVLQTPEIEPKEPARENRYGTKFGTSQGFSADTLRELRELQETREKEQDEARETARREALAQVPLASPVVEPSITPEVAPIAPAFAIQTETIPSQIQAEKPLQETPPTPAPKTEDPDVPAPQKEAFTPEKAPVPAPTKPKPPAPRW